MNKRTALLSVFHKEGIVEFARGLVALGWTLYASGGTARYLKEACIPVTDVAELVGGGAILGHRVVTLSREVHAGLLARPIPEDETELEKLSIPWFDLVCVDLYPLEQAIADPVNDLTKIIEMIDIGGPTMISSASKGQRIVICDPADREFVLERLKADGDVPLIDRERLAAKADKVVAAYRLLSAGYRSHGLYSGFIGERVASCKYGENAWQTPAALYSTGARDQLALDRFKLVAGTAPSYNNLVDLDRLLQTVTHLAATFDLNTGKVPLIAVAVKHGNPCGAAIGTDPLVVLQKTVTGDPEAIFGGLVMTNFPLGEAEAETLLAYGVSNGRRLLDGIIAPSFTDEAIARLKRKKDKCRLLANEALAALSKDSLDMADRFRYVRGGCLRQPNYTFIFDFKLEALQQFGEITDQQKSDLLLAKAVCDTSNSNTITIVKDDMLIGNGTGQMHRGWAAKIAIDKVVYSHHTTFGAVAASDSFFPFPDGPEMLCQSGVAVILATTGSIKDEEIKKLITEAGVTLVWLPDTVGRGFFGH